MFQVLVAEIVRWYGNTEEPDMDVNNNKKKSIIKKALYYSRLH